MIYSFGDLTPLLEGDGHFVAQSASVIGNVVMKPKSSVWFSAVVRGDVEKISIGYGSNVQDAAVLHADPGFPLEIGDYVTIGHHAMVHGCTVGEGTLIGINAVVLNGSKIGKGCLIGANALVTEGMEVPDGSMVLGSPGKVIKALSEEHQHALKIGTEHYIQNAARFASELVEVKQ